MSARAPSATTSISARCSGSRPTYELLGTHREFLGRSCYCSGDRHTCVNRAHLSPLCGSQALAGWIMVQIKWSGDLSRDLWVNSARSHLVCDRLAWGTPGMADKLCWQHRRNSPPSAVVPGVGDAFCPRGRFASRMGPRALKL